MNVLRWSKTPYWDAQNVVIEQVNFLPLAAGNAEMNRYLIRDLDITYEMPSDRFAELQKNINEVYASPMIMSYYYLFNQKPPLDDVRVRRALALSINRDIITK